MTPQGNSQKIAQEKVALSGQRIREAADRWNAVDRSAIAECLSALDRSVADLGDAARILTEIPAASWDSVRSEVASLKSSACRLERLVDASSAFLRLAPGLADDAGLYQSGGSICSSVSATEMRGIQG